MPRLTTRIAKLLAGDDWPSSATTAKGEIEKSEVPFAAWDSLATRRTGIYDEMDEIDETVPEGSRALSVLADNAVNSRDGSVASFRVLYNGAYVGSAKQKLIERMLERTQLYEEMYTIARATLKYGDCFVQPVVAEDMHIDRLMVMPPETMRRNESVQGVLEPESFTQCEEGSNKRIAGFREWQIYHLRWNREANAKYGKGQLCSARNAWKKMTAIEEAFVINRLTRAFARLVIYLDTTGLTKDESKAEAKKVLEALRKRNAVMGDNARQELSVVKDIVVTRNRSPQGGKFEEDLNDVKVLDTSSSADWSTDPMVYFRNKFITQTGVPKAHLGLEKEINAKATLQWQDERFVRTVRRVQMVMSELVTRLVKIEFALNGVSINNVDIDVEWQSPSTTDTMDRATAFKDNASALKDFMGNFDNEGQKAVMGWVLRNQLGWSETQTANTIEHIGGGNDDT